MRLLNNFYKKARKILKEKLYGYLADIEEQAGKMFDEFIKLLTEKENITEKLKADKPMLWIQKMK